ncbi:MAG: phosphoglucomutase/phosphomannomutase family protein, partial [Thermoanaerobacteraceae bacterium]|nr:phosphoglucomutase/phosphomannomutase family protein [Thermoanaerobacteraceae bacterium]
VHGKGLGDLLEDIWSRFGRLYSERLDRHTSAAGKERVLGLLQELNPAALGGLQVQRRIAVDGVKLVLENGSWVLVRASGTEPLFRIYVEASSEEELRRLQQAMREMLGL